MLMKDAIQFLAICEKLKIEANPNLTKVEKEIWKSLVDAAKKDATGKSNL